MARPRLLKILDISHQTAEDAFNFDVAKGLESNVFVHIH